MTELGAEVERQLWRSNQRIASSLSSFSNKFIA